VTAPDPHPVVTILTRPLTNWLRVPTWGAVLALLAALGYLAVAGHDAGQAESAAVAALAGVLREGKAYRATIERLERAEQLHLAAATQAERGAAAALATADSLQRVADSLAKAAQASQPFPSVPIPPDPVTRTLRLEIGALRGTVDSQQAALVAVTAAYRAADLRAGTAEARVTALETAGRAVVQAAGCKLLSLHPCIRGVHLGAYLGEQLLPKPQGSFGLAVVWSP